MLFSLALILIIGFLLSGLFNRIDIPGLLAMIITGIVLGPHVLDLISDDILNISGDLREIALIVILLRAGLTLDLQDLKKVGRPAVLMCFVPALLEIGAITLLAPMLFHISTIEAAIMGTVVAAVSPAVVVPRMIKLMESGYGQKKRVPHLVMAGATVDDVVVIILFTAFLGMYQGEGFHAASLIKVPISIILGLALGIASGLVLVRVFKRFHMRDTIKVLTILSTAFVLVTIEDLVSQWVPISGLLAVMALGGTILKARDHLAKRLMGKFSKIWVGAEVLLFVLVGAAVDITSVGDVGLLSVVLVLGALLFRVAGVYISLIGTALNTKERLFCAIAYLPKATVQAAIGAIPLASGVASGNLILSVAVLAIMITAPIGAIGVDKTYQRLLVHDG
ncbi:MAG: cation:proton antiporter [Eubacteriales bacterium]